MSNTDKISELNDAGRMETKYFSLLLIKNNSGLLNLPPEYRITCSPLVAALDVADDLVQRKPEEGTNASVDVSCSGHRHALNPDGVQLENNLSLATAAAHSAHSNRSSRSGRNRSRCARSMPTGTLNQTHRTGHARAMAGERDTDDLDAIDGRRR
jgi:hypothetical protein